AVHAQRRGRRAVVDHRPDTQGLGGGRAAHRQIRGRHARSRGGGRLDRPGAALERAVSDADEEPWEDAWEDQDTTPAKVESALREMLATRHHEAHAFVRAPALDTIVDPVLVPDLATMVWAPHGHDEGVEALRRLAQVVLLDSQDANTTGGGLARAADLSDSAYVVDLAWLRSTPWRERIAAAFDPPAERSRLSSIAGVTVRHREDSLAAAVL